jgi:hypothetical protein
MKLPFNPGKTGYAVAVFVLIFLVALATKCHSEGIVFGVGSSIFRGSASTLQLAWQWPSPQSKDAHFETAITMIAPSQFNGVDQRNQFAWSVVYIDGFRNFDIGLGPAFLQNKDAYNSSGANFNLLIGYHWKRWFMRWCHFSNAGTHDPNIGRDLMLVGTVFQ